MTVCGGKTDREVGCATVTAGLAGPGGTLQQKQHGRVVSEAEQGLYKVVLYKVGKGPLLIPESFASERI